MDDESAANQVHTNKLTQLLLLDDIKNEKTFEMSDDEQNLCHICSACQIPIADQFYLRVGSKIFHESCLQCAVCQIALDKQQTCFFKGLQILCRQDYYKHFGNKCSKCGRHIQPSDWVRRAREHVYHLACFACNTCKRQLSTGEEFALQSSHVLCKTHFIDPNETNDGKDDTKQGKAKRVRTTFTEEQLQILQANFEVDSNPDGQDLERIAQITGLSKRVIQVWFQNTRARQKKVRDRKAPHEHHLHSHSHHCYISQETTHRRRNTRSTSSSSNSNKSGDTLTKRTTQIWFQNARARIKKKPCATTSSPPTYNALTNNNLNIVDTLHLSAEQHLDSKVNQQHLQWSPSHTSPGSSLIYDGENSNEEYSTGYI
ncbi:unnamed protein product [Adineta ricciae]|uniref:LIM/homeobox protein Awh n=1 Tax=Adineta ricciae TaxID=249248 RepID=A0A814Z9X1_ADIRI|nr:unnamed protein product [Adineta ricciae]